MIALASLASPATGPLLVGPADVLISLQTALTKCILDSSQIRTRINTLLPALLNLDLFSPISKGDLQHFTVPFYSILQR